MSFTPFLVYDFDYIKYIYIFSKTDSIENIHNESIKCICYIFISFCILYIALCQKEINIEEQ
jgi:hypothetical protein